MSSSSYASRHLGADDDAIQRMAAACGHASLDTLVDATVPAAIRASAPLDLPPALGEQEALAELREIMGRNKVCKSFIGLGYHGTITPPVIQRNILENPGWYTAYTPYQAEISQGRLEALLNFQTMVCELTALPVANASLLDEGTAAAEAVTLCHGSTKIKNPRRILVDDRVFAHTLAVIRTRCVPVGVEISVARADEATLNPEDCVFAVIIQYPAGDGSLTDWRATIDAFHQQGALVIMISDPLALTLLTPPGELGADIAVGSTQRFGVPMGGGGPHAAYMAVKDELKRKLPGRLIGVSVDSHGNPAMRLSLQTREQHIRRDKATSNICTAQVLLAVMAGMYAVWHGPEGLKRIAKRVHGHTATLAAGLESTGIAVENRGSHFDTLTIHVPNRATGILLAAEARGFNLRRIENDRFGVTCDELTTDDDITALLEIISGTKGRVLNLSPAIPASLQRTSPFLNQEVFQRYHTEHELLRYINRLAAKDLTLCDSMIPLGSCTMKLNATSTMMPLSWPEVSAMHPYAPASQSEGTDAMIAQLEQWLAVITGFAAVSVAPNAGSQGEYAGLLAIRDWHLSRGDEHRDVCLIPVSAHGTNPASAVMAGMKVVAVKCDNSGNIDINDLRIRAGEHAADLAALMITYPSTHGVFEEGIRDICAIVHEHGGQVYMDGANMNAQVGLTSPGLIGADVCHLNLHKTFCIPHGGGGPGVGPVCVAAHLAPFIPGRGPNGPVVSAPHGSMSINVIPWMYICMMGGEGLTNATKLAILNANYIARRVESFFPVLYKGTNGLVAHECIIDVRPYKESAGVSVEDVAKRLIDYGYHAPTMSWPVAGTLMIEPTESESQAELDRFCDALIGIHGEIMAVQSGQADREQNALRYAPHTAACLLADNWSRPYSRELAAFPDIHSRRHKYWPPVGRVDNVYGDKNLVCTCDSVEAFAARSAS
ncbi:MAG TPA: aminomethyl-transferring glycine dehydrogenase [Verrucomicrobiales bacterium]|nr:aminomethyl-transferring glycine dehydrogenase [Verrucomicrobiales bacterium]